MGDMWIGPWAIFDQYVDWALNSVAAVMTLNFQELEHGYLMYEYQKHIKRMTDTPLMVMEFWSGWFDHWGEKHHVWPVEGKAVSCFVYLFE